MNNEFRRVETALHVPQIRIYIHGVNYKQTAYKLDNYFAIGWNSSREFLTQKFRIKNYFFYFNRLTNGEKSVCKIERFLLPAFRDRLCIVEMTSW
jgi:hypothetical protein